jgi:isopenicillin N synthase-like dioxygenase
MNALPIVDLALSGESDKASLNRIAADVGAASRDVGFFYVVNHGVDPELIVKAFAQSHDFFGLPVADKRKLAIETIGGNRGYSGLLHEALDPARGPDMKEAFNVGLELAADDPELLTGKPFRSLNAWPGVPGFRETLLSYYDACAGLGARLHRVRQRPWRQSRFLRREIRSADGDAAAPALSRSAESRSGAHRRGRAYRLWQPHAACD